MRELLNVLYVQTQGTVLHLDHDAVRVEMENQPARRLPLIRLSGIVVFGRVTVTPSLIERCAADGRALAWMDLRGRFRARIEGQTRGNVLLRRAQHLALSDRERTTAISRQIVAGKIQNSRQVLMRAAREAQDPSEGTYLGEAALELAMILEKLREAGDLAVIRGMEGEAARTYFGVFGYMVKGARDAFTPAGRTRRPPRDRANAILSFLYTLLRFECSAALEGVGLDPQIGYLHALRPGRPALALDLMEELRPVLADRLALRLVNRRQLRADDFETTPGGGVMLSEQGRRTTIVAYQQRKEEEVSHRVMAQKLPLGLVPHVQSRLLARHLRSELREYPPFLYR